MTLKQAAVLVAQAFLWGATYVLISLSQRAFSPGQTVFARAVIAAAILSTILFVQGGPARSALRDALDRPWTTLAFVLCSAAAPMALISFAQKAVPASVTGILIASMPLWTAVLALKLDRSEAVDARQAAGLIVGLVGVGFVVGVGAVHSFSEALGAAAVLLSAGCFAMSGFIVKLRYSQVPTLTRGVLSLVLSSVLLLPIGVTGGGVHPTTTSVLAILGLAMGSTAIGMLLLFWLIDELGPRRAVVGSYLAPAFSLVLAVIVLGEHLHTGAILGFILIISGVALASTRAPVPVPAT
jgi:drug/metabolite transporter (DMT)-like permease